MFLDSDGHKRRLDFLESVYGMNSEDIRTDRDRGPTSAKTRTGKSTSGSCTRAPHGEPGPQQRPRKQADRSCMARAPSIHPLRPRLQPATPRRARRGRRPRCAEAQRAHLSLRARRPISKLATERGIEAFDAGPTTTATREVRDRPLLRCKIGFGQYAKASRNRCPVTSVKHWLKTDREVR